MGHTLGVPATPVGDLHRGKLPSASPSPGCGDPQEIELASERLVPSPSLCFSHSSSFLSLYFVCHSAFLINKSFLKMEKILSILTLVYFSLIQEAKTTMHTEISHPMIHMVVSSGPKQSKPGIDDSILVLQQVVGSERGQRSKHFSLQRLPLLRTQDETGALHHEIKTS